ncbi:hypothetical protein EZV62_028055 [Acer yangbiense]|uniref:C-JID domain-containing protein n=1 Tax=Acer yangbiense TaxID=1000413 RepID=A0A5C7GQE4_9ROSI|nr:hypothetical protein EZV62_028055 [Acer yangbiense]
MPGSEFPEWSSYQSCGSLVNIQVLRHDLVNKKLMGFAICAVLGPDEYCSRREHLLVGVCCNFKTYDDHMKIYDSSWYYSPYYFEPHGFRVFINSDHILLGYSSFSEFYSSNLEKLLASDNDYVDISFEFDANYEGCNQLKCCAVYPIFADPIEKIGATIEDIGNVEREVANLMIMRRKWNHILREFAPNQIDALNQQSRPLIFFIERILHSTIDCSILLLLDFCSLINWVVDFVILR